MSIKEKLIFLLIIVLALLLRALWLDHTPPHLSNDEISIAYDAYSISKTSRDEHNHFLPISFQSHNTYKAPLYIYLSIPTTILLGNNEYSVKLPSVILGTLTVLFLGLLIYELTKKTSLSLLTSFILAITPWHIYTSRMALESNIALFFVILGIYSFYKGLNVNKSWYIFLSFFSFALSLYSYHTEWIFTPLIIFILMILNWKHLQKKSIYLAGILLFSILTAPLVADYLNNLHTFARANTETLLSDDFLSGAFKSTSLNLFQKVQLLLYAYLGNYSEYINFYHLFFSMFNDQLYNHPYQIGAMLFIFIPSFLIGFTQIKKVFGKFGLFILLWVLLAPMVPAFTRGGANFVRNLVSVIPYVIVISTGSYFLWNRFKSKFIRIIFCLLIFINFFYFSLLYFHHFPLRVAEGFQYGYKQIAMYLKGAYGQYQTIIIDPKFGPTYSFEGVPHLYIPYYTYYDPQKFLAERRSDKTSLYFGKYIIRGINWEEEKSKLLPSILYVVPASNLPDQEVLKKLKEVYIVYLPNGRIAFRLYEVK